MTTLANEKVWVDKKVYDDAERQYYEAQAKLRICGSPKTIPFQPPVPVPDTSTVTVLSKKQKQKIMAPVQNIAPNAQTSPKKSKKKNKGKNRSSSEKELENKIIPVEREKEVPVEEVMPAQVLVDKATEKLASPPRDVCPVKQTKNKDDSVKKGKNAEPVVITHVQKVEIAPPKGGAFQCSLASEVAKARQHIKNSLECMDSVAALAGVPNVEVMNKINSLEKENKDLKKTVDELRKSLQELKVNFEAFTSKFGAGGQVSTPAASVAKLAAPPAASKDDSDDGVDLFGSDDEEESAEAAKVREERLAAYNAKKSKKPALIAKSNIILDVKPWDDETDMKALEAAVRGVIADGLLWGAAKLVPLAYGIHKLQISCVVEDDKVSIDWLTEELEKLNEFVQSVDIAAFNKV